MAFDADQLDRRCTAARFRRQQLIEASHAQDTSISAVRIEHSTFAYDVPCLHAVLRALCPSSPGDAVRLSPRIGAGATRAGRGIDENDLHAAERRGPAGLRLHLMIASAQ